MAFRSLWVFLFCAFVGLSTATANATVQDPDQAAKQAYARGAELFKNRHYTEAATAFEEGNRLKAPSGLSVQPGADLSGARAASQSD